MTTYVTIQGHTYSDGTSNEGTGIRYLDNGGHWQYFFPLISDVVAEATAVVNNYNLAVNYATKIDGYASGTDNSAKSWAIGGTGTGQPTAGSAKDWAIKATSPDGTTNKSAKSYATDAATSAGDAAASAASAAAIAGAFVGTSTTSWTPALGAMTFATQSGEQYTAGTFLSVVSAATPTAWGVGQVTSYTGTSLVMDIQVISGTGAHTDWNISLTGTRGATGATGLGITPQAVGFTLAGGTTSKTLTCDIDITASALALKNGADGQLSRQMLIDCGYTFLDKANSGTTTQTFDYTAGSHQKVTATGNHTIATSNWPPTGNLGSLLMEYVNGGAFTLTFPTINWIKPDGTTTTSISTYLAANTGRTALQASGTDFILLWSRDAGTTIYGKLL